MACCAAPVHQQAAAQRHSMRSACLLESAAVALAPLLRALALLLGGRRKHLSLLLLLRGSRRSSVTRSGQRAPHAAPLRLLPHSACRAAWGWMCSSRGASCAAVHPHQHAQAAPLDRCTAGLACLFQGAGGGEGAFAAGGLGGRHSDLSSHQDWGASDNQGRLQQRGQQGGSCGALQRQAVRQLACGWAGVRHGSCIRRTSAPGAGPCSMGTAAITGATTPTTGWVSSCRSWRPAAGGGR